MKRQVVLIDSGGYNIGSLQAALQRLDVESQLSRDTDEIRAASHVILPGVGAAAPAMQKLRDYGLAEVIPSLTQPVLGICLGMQLLFEHSAEGDTDCLGIFRGSVEPLQASRTDRVPHMGWNTLHWQSDTDLRQALPDPAWMYFVHSYAAPLTDQCLASSSHTREFAAIVQADNFMAVQFHPERSAVAGNKLLQAFLGNKR